MKILLVILLFVNCGAFTGFLPSKVSSNSPSLTSFRTSFRTPFHTSLSSFNNPGGEEAPLEERLLACFPYLLPLADGAEFGKFIYQRLPVLGTLERATVQPLVNVFHAVPFSSLIIFIGFSFAARQPSLSRFIRFNIQQAILLDIALIFPSLFGGAANELPRYLVEPATNFVFYAFAASIVYCFFSNLALGKEPNEIPVVSSAANQQLGPF
ncbi:hypothetical protein TrRE_jg7819 [Triparma retinervis]|uniref:Protein TIC 20 n=1 Tax=Triparma retinervis TaxID=2557542 RepID=A0A9W6ZD62_9STRA|nr:hypothetical protein TrRE_jg7819 [Triparma retinervis]